MISVKFCVWGSSFSQNFGNIGQIPGFYRTHFVFLMQFGFRRAASFVMSMLHLLLPGEPVTRRRVFLLVYVHTAPERYAQRLLLRQTWAKPNLYDLDIRLAFFVGRRPKDPVLEQAVRLEAAQFRDMIQADFEDSYRNLTLKAMSALTWISRYCNRTRYVLKTDDDAYVNMRALLRHLGITDTLHLFCFIYYSSAL